MIPDKHQSLPKVAEVCADGAEILALCVSRFIAAGYMTGDVACWEAAYDGAERKLGRVQGRSFVAIVTGLMRAIRTERQGDWSFMPATCCRVTPHEGELMAAIAGARRTSGKRLHAWWGCPKPPGRGSSPGSCRRAR